MTDNNTPWSKPVKKLRNQSTIYKRHERRLAKTYSLKDDPRPAFVRVLSGLPLLSLVFPPFQPTHDAKASSTSTSRFSEDTVFTAHSSKEMTSDSSHVPSHPSATLLQTAFAAALGGAIAEMVVGKGLSTGTRNLAGKAESPFTATAALQGSGTLSVSRSHIEPSSKQLSSPMFRQSVPNVLSGAASSALLFGTRDYVARQLSSADSVPPAYASALSSAAGGGAVAAASTAVKAAHVQMKRSGIVSFPKGAESLLKENRMAFSQGAAFVYGKEMIGAVLLFGVYDSIKTFLSENNDNKRSSNFSIAAAGAIAGVCHRAVTFPSSGRGMGFAVIRAAPANALLFLCYESIIKLVSKTPSPSARQS